MKSRKFSGKIRTVFKEINPQHHRFWLSIESSKGVHAKNLKTTLLSVNLSKAFDSIYRGKMEQMHQAYSLLKETVTTLWKHNSSFIQWWHWILWHYRWSFTRRYISTICIHNLSRLHNMNINRSNGFILKTDKKLTISHRNCDKCRLHRWSSNTPV